MARKMTELELTKLIQQLDLDATHADWMTERESGIDNDTLVRDIPAQSETATDGWIQVKNHTIMVRDPFGDGSPPVIRGEYPVRLIINNEVVDARRFVSSVDCIRWEIEEQPLFEIKVSKDQMQAYFHLKSKERYAWHLIDTEPMSEMVIRAEQDKNYILETVTLIDVLSAIQQMAIKSNLDIDAVQRELEQPTYQPVLIARGKAAVPGKDADLKLYFPDQVRSQFFDVSGRVDFRNHLQIPTASSGDVIARKIPMVKGSAGYDVFGKPIQPAEPRDIIVVARPSAEITPDGEIRALISGRPRITGHKVKVVDISPSYTVPSDVNLNTGNIVFSGDVIVYGNVMDHMIIESLGNVYVYGSAYNATITATGSIFVRGNVLGCKLYSGYFGVMFNRLYQTAKTLTEHLANLITASNLLLHKLEVRKQKVHFGQIVMLLVEKKFHAIPALVKELLAVLANIQHIKQNEYQKLGEMCSILLQPFKILTELNMSFYQSLLTMLHEAHKEVARMQEAKAEVRLNQCHNSEIKSNGNIIIQRDGVILSQLYAARSILFKHESSVCRGSTLEAGRSIVAKIVGGKTGVDTLLKAKMMVSVRKMFTGRICIGKYCIDVDKLIEDKTFNSRELRHSAG